jgi:para-aminobenzoate synthetase component 1
MINEQLICKKLDLSLLSEQVFSFFADQQYAVFLDSANPSHPNNRFDLIAINPTNTVEVKNNQTMVDGLPVDDSAFDAINHFIAQFNSSTAPFNLPFSGGALGLFGYDLGRVIESIPSIAEQDIELGQMLVGIYPDALIYDQRQAQWYYIAQPSCDADKRLNDILETINSNEVKQHDVFKLASNWHSNLTKSEYSKRFDAVQAYLKSGDCYQINLAQRFKAQYNGHPWHAYLTLRQANHAPFSAYINTGEQQILSLSPERFIQVHDKQVETKPIKGTVPRSDDPLIDAKNKQRLEASTKDRAENVMIVDLLRNDLGKVAKAGTVEVPKLFEVESFNAVHHLVSTVTSTLDKQYTAVDQLKVAFPGGSITGAPKIRAMEIIEELEPHRRSIYCGSIGYISACGKMDTSITIRTLVCEHKHIYCWAGGGVVADSTMESEWQETFDKVNRILPVLE